MHTFAKSAVIAAICGLTNAVDVVSPEDAPIDIDFAYAEHMTKYGKSYNSIDEYETRKAIFAKNDSLIREHNAKEGTTFTIGHNAFSDWSSEEWATMLMESGKFAQGEEQDKATVSSGIVKGPGTVKMFNTNGMPTSLDWRA